jgi:diguanylate cyclase
MLFNYRKKDPEGRESVNWAAEYASSEERLEFFLSAARALLQCIREFALDIQELDSSGFKTDLAEFAETLASEKKIQSLQHLFASRRAGIGTFAQRQKDYLRDREIEFKDIIEILSKAMAVLDSENRAYNRSILEQSQRLEEMTLLDDIKRIKQALLQEVEQLREAVSQKEARDGAKIEMLSRQVAVLNNELKSARSESERDGLTGILNRRAFDRHLADLIARNTVKRQEFALLMIDLDDFKRINDIYGHLAGDSVLAAVVNKCRQSVRGADVLARYGGEEFAIILSGASLRNAVKKGRQICQAIAATRYVLEGMPPSKEPISLTVSIGVSACRAGDTGASLVDRADKALYLAKASGKNRVKSEKDLK